MKIIARTTKYQWLSEVILNLKDDSSKDWRSFPCMEWPFGIGKRFPNGDGYGVFNLNNKKLYAHRVSWSLKNGPIPEAKPHILHHCDNPKCFRPIHLFAGTHAENLADCAAKNRNSYGEKNFLAKLRTHQVVEIRRLLASGEKRSSIATRFGIDRANVGYIARGDSWKRAI